MISIGWPLGTSCFNTKDKKVVWVWSASWAEDAIPGKRHLCLTNHCAKWYRACWNVVLSCECHRAKCCRYQPAKQRACRRHCLPSVLRPLLHARCMPISGLSNVKYGQAMTNQTMAAGDGGKIFNRAGKFLDGCLQVLVLHHSRLKARTWRMSAPTSIPFGPAP